MSSDTKLILKRPGRVERWEQRERGDYNLERFGEEFRNRLYSDRGRELLQSEGRHSVERDRKVSV